jgi:hypothetical protein
MLILGSGSAALRGDLVNKRHFPFLISIGIGALLSIPACEGELDGSEADTALGDDSTTGEAEGGGDGDGDAESPDSDEDGLSDAEEEELGTDPLDKDSDDDNYWDSWEVLEGTDPLDFESRIYTGFWPYSPTKDELPQGTWAEASTETGSQFPRQSFLDQNGDLVDLYDFNNFTINDTGQPAYFIIDMSAQWCGPCHIMADWISGVDNSDTLSLQQIYPTVREKVHNLRVWWITIVVENANGDAPTLNDSQSWATTHPDSVIPVLVDETQQVRNTYNGGQYPFFFLLDPNMAIELWKIPDANDNAHPALWAVQQYL